MQARSKKAFTLVELIFEIAVITFLVIPIVLLLGQLTINIVETEANSTATLLGVDKTEEILEYYQNSGFDFDFTTLSDTAEGYGRAISTQCVSSDDLITPNDCSAGYKIVTVTVSNNAIPDVVIYLLLTDI